jgi:predicted dehydrogenase
MKNTWKILLVGLGAAGQRHARNLNAILGDRVDLSAFRSRNISPCLTKQFEVIPGADPATNLGITVFTNLNDALAQQPDAVIIANPSSLHLSVASAAAAVGCAIFFEKPLSHNWEGVTEFLELVDRQKLMTLVGYQWRFHPLLIDLKQYLATKPLGRTIAVRATYGEYLPGWHPYEDYRQSYAARSKLGGGVLLTQIHDIDYLGWLLGWPDRAFSVGGHLSDLEIDVEDVVSTLLTCQVDGRNIPIHIHQDYLQKPSSRNCEIIAEGGRIHFDLIASTLKVWDRSGQIVRDGDFSTFDRNEMFVAAMSHFVDCLEGRATSLIPAKEGARSLAVALAAKRSLLSTNPEPIVYP